MSILIVVFSNLFLFILTIIEVYFKKKISNLLYWVICLFLIIISSLKTAETSNDTSNYVDFFLNVAPDLSNFSVAIFYGYEPFYVLINAFVKTFGNTIFLLFFFQSILSVGLYGYVIKKVSPYPIFSLYIYVTTFFYLTEIIILRFGIAVSLGFFVMYLLQQNRKLAAIFFILLSTLNHVTGIILIIPFILHFFNFSKKKLYLLLFILGFSFLISFFAKSILIFINSISSGYIQLMLQRAIDRYFDSESTAGIKRIILYIPLFFISIIYYQRGIKLNAIYKEVFLYFYLAIFFMVTLSTIESSFARLNLLFLCSNILLGPLLYITINKKYKILLFFYYIVLCNYLFLRHLFFNSGGTVNLYI